MALLTAILIAAALCNLQAQQAPEPPGRPTISVAGEAVVNVPPDKIILRFGVETFDQQLAKGTKQNNAIMKKAFEAISAAGIAEKDVQTDHLSIGIDYEHYQKKILKGYNVRNVFAVTIADPAKVEELITSLLAVGVNTIHGIEFQTSELNKYREQARELALKAAKEKAEKMAAVLGQSLGDPVQINETGGCSPGGFGRNRAVQTKTNFVSNVEGSSDSEFAGTLALGKISIRANVGVIFDLKK